VRQLSRTNDGLLGRRHTPQSVAAADMARRRQIGSGPAADQHDVTDWSTYRSQLAVSIHRCAEPWSLGRAAGREVGRIGASGGARWKTP